MPEVKTASSKREKAETSPRVAFELTPAMADELDRMMEVADFASKPEVFRRAFTLLRIHVDAAMQNREIYMVDPSRPDEKYIISLPFTVKREARAAE